MASDSVQTVQKLSTELTVTMYDHDPADSTVATDVSWVDMRDYESAMILAFASALTGNGVTAFKILCNTASDGSGTDKTLAEHAVGSAPDAVGDYLVLECHAGQIAPLGANYRYISAQLTCNNAADENVVVYIRKNLHPITGSTADTVA